MVFVGGVAPLAADVHGVKDPEAIQPDFAAGVILGPVVVADCHFIASEVQALGSDYRQTVISIRGPGVHRVYLFNPVRFRIPNDNRHMTGVRAAVGIDFNAGAPELEFCNVADVAAHGLGAVRGAEIGSVGRIIAKAAIGPHG